MATAVVERLVRKPSTFWRFAADASRRAVHAAHDARILKTIAEDALETRVFETAHRIKKHPFKSVAIAFAIGVPLGALIGRAGAHGRQSKK